MKCALINLSGRNNSGPVIGLEIAKAMAQNGYRVCAIVAKDAKNLSDWQNERLIEDIFVIKTYTSLRDFLPRGVFFVLREKRRIKDHYREMEFDLIIKPFFHVWSEIITKQIKHKKVVTICHDPIMHSGEPTIKRVLYRNHIKNSDEVVVLTKSFIPIVSKNYKIPAQRVHYISHGLMSTYKEKQVNRKIIDYNESSTNFLFFGRIKEYKGVEVLVDAYRELYKSHRDVSLTIVGKGKIDALSNRLRSPLNIRVINEYVPDEEVGCYFDGPNVVTVLPYLDATQSGVIPIAMEYNTPIIASDVGGLREQMLNGEFGIFVEPGNIYDLASKMEWFVVDRSLFDAQRQIMSDAIKQLEWKSLMGRLLKEL